MIPKGHAEKCHSYSLVSPTLCKQPFSLVSGLSLVLFILQKYTGTHICVMCVYSYVLIFLSIQKATYYIYALHLSFNNMLCKSFGSKNFIPVV